MTWSYFSSHNAKHTGFNDSVLIFHTQDRKDRADTDYVETAPAASSASTPITLISGRTALIYAAIPEELHRTLVKDMQILTMSATKNPI